MFTKCHKLSEINDFGKFKKQIQDKITELETIKIKIGDFLKINCFSDIQACADIVNDKKKKPKDLIKYIGNTFGYDDYVNKFKKFEITKYALLQQFPEDENYYIISKTCPIDDPECRFFVVTINLSIDEKHRHSIPIDKIWFIPETHNLYYINTDRYNLSQGKMFKSDFINTINDIKKENIPPQYIDLTPIENIFKILYRYNEKINEYMPDVINKYDNIVIFLSYINRLEIIYDSVTNNTEPTEENFDDIKEHICYAYNYYLYLSKLYKILDNKKNINIINDYLKKTKEEVYGDFIRDIKDLYTKLHNLKIVCDNSILVNYISE